MSVRIVQESFDAQRGCILIVEYSGEWSWEEFMRAFDDVNKRLLLDAEHHPTVLIHNMFNQVRMPLDALSSARDMMVNPDNIVVKHVLVGVGALAMSLHQVFLRMLPVAVRQSITIMGDVSAAVEYAHQALSPADV